MNTLIVYLNIERVGSLEQDDSGLLHSTEAVVKFGIAQDLAHVHRQQEISSGV